MSAKQKIMCRECGKSFVTVTNTHLKKHNMTIEDYKEKYPNEKFTNCEWLNCWRNSDNNKKNLQLMSDKVHNSEEISKQRIRNIKKTWSLSKTRSAQSKLMKKLVNDNPEKFKSLFESNVTDIMKMSNYDRWVLKFGKREANKRLKNWKKNNKIPNSSRNTNIEIICKNLLDNLGIKYIHQYSEIKNYWCDFYLPKFNLIIEVDGDYWHANPNQYSKDDAIGPKKIMAKTIWEYDNKKSLDIINCGYNILRIYGSKIKNISIEEFFEDIVRASGKLEE